MYQKRIQLHTIRAKAMIQIFDRMEIYLCSDLRGSWLYYVYYAVM